MRKSKKLPLRLEKDLAVSTQSEGAFPNRVYHAVNPGDLIAAMGAIKKLYEITKRKSIVYQSTNTAAMYYQGAVHPTVNEEGVNVCCNVPMFNMLKPLIESQEYIHSFEEYKGQKYEIDFNVIRGKTNVNLPHGSIQGWIPLAFPDLSFDLSKPWISLSGDCPKNILKQVKGKIIINFTERYRSNIIDYYFLQKHANDIIFAGTEKEHYLFTGKWSLNVPRLQVKNFLELAHALKNCRFFLGNQSMCYNICESIKVPRILEICSYAQNCIHMIGEHSYGFFYQAGVEYYFSVLFNKTASK